MGKIEYAELARKLWPFMAGYVGQLAGGTSVITASASSSPAGASAPAYGAYLTLGTDPTLTQERVFTLAANGGLSGSDAGAGGAYTLTLGTPSTLTVSASNALSGANHSHAIASSSNPGAAASILASDASGILTLPQFTATTKMRTPLIDTASGALTLTPATAVAITDGKTLNGSTTFVSGFAGAGWRIDHGVSYASQSTLEVDNVIVRGLMRVYELVINKIRVSRGSLIVSPGGGKVASVSGSGPYTLTFDDDHGVLANDKLRAQKFTGSGTYQSLITCSSVSSSKVIVVTLDSGSAPAAGYEYAVVGNSSDATRQGGLFLTADDSGAPFMDIYDGVASHADFNTSAKTKARLGKLTGITDPFWGTLGGYGLYTARGYLTGVYINGSLVIGPGVGFSVPAVLYCAFDTAPGSAVANTNGHLGQPATITGTGVLGQPGNFGGGVAVSDAVTNGCSNPSFESNTTGWAVVNNGTGATITISQSGERSWIGTKSLKCVATGASSYSYTNARVGGPASSFAWNIGSNPTLSSYILIESGTWRVIFEDSGQNFRAYTELTSASGWVRVKALVVNTFGFNYPSVKVSIMPMAAGTCYVDGVLYDNYGALRPYCDTSVTAGTLGHTVTMPAKWTIMCWAYRDSYQARNYGYIWSHSNDYSSVYYNNTNADVIGTTSAGVPSNGWHHYAITYDGTALRSYRDASLIGTFTTSYTKAQTIYIGGQSGGNQFNGEIDDFAVVSRQLSVDELTAIINSTAPLNVTRSNYEMVLADSSTAAKVVANAYGIFGTDASAKPTFSLVNVNSTVNGEAMTSGDTLLGDNSSSKGNTFFDQSTGTLNIRIGTTNVLSFSSTGSVDGVLNLGSSGGIWQGSGGSFASPGTGLKIYNTSSLGVLELWNSGVGILSLRPDNGLTILGGTGYVSRQSVNFVDSVGTRLGEVYGYSDGSTYNAVRMQGYSNSASRAAATFVQAAQEASGLAQIYIWASKFTPPSTLGQPNAYIYLESDQPNNQAVIQLQVRSTSTTSTFTLDQTGVTLTNGIKAFKIDHPLAPAERWLYHNAVEGDGHYTLYRGNITLDHSGRAVVQMPDWFDALNDDLVITYGEWGREVSDAPRTSHRIKNGWVIVGQPLRRVSWMASGVRRDAWAAGNPLQVESEKDDKDKGYVAAWREYGLEQSFEKPAAQAGAS